VRPNAESRVSETDVQGQGEDEDLGGSLDTSTSGYPVRRSQKHGDHVAHGTGITLEKALQGSGIRHKMKRFPRHDSPILEALPERPMPYVRGDPNEISSLTRSFMRLVPHPVAIITSKNPHDTSGNMLRGATVSSFNTVTLEPDVIVSFNLKTPSSTMNAIVASSKFAVHLLTVTDGAGRLANLFIGKPGVQGYAEHSDQFMVMDSADPKVPCEDVEVKNTPLLQRRACAFAVKDAIPMEASVTDYDNSAVRFVLECAFMPEESPRVADHIIVLGKVVNVFCPESSQSADVVRPQDLCLSYVNGQYKGVNGHAKLKRHLQQKDFQPSPSRARLPLDDQRAAIQGQLNRPQVSYHDADSRFENWKWKRTKLDTNVESYDS